MGFLKAIPELVVIFKELMGLFNQLLTFIRQNQLQAKIKQTADAFRLHNQAITKEDKIKALQEIQKSFKGL